LTKDIETSRKILNSLIKYFIVPNPFKRRIAISGEMPKHPFNSADSVLRETLSPLAASVTLISTSKTLLFLNWKKE
jgi:hypothetical protein